MWGVGTPFGLANIDREVQRQATIVAHANDFKFMFWLLPTDSPAACVYAQAAGERGEG